MSMLRSRSPVSAAAGPVQAPTAANAPISHTDRMVVLPWLSPFLSSVEGRPGSEAEPRRRATKDAMPGHIYSRRCL
jgi:hypothetical protein